MTFYIDGNNVCHWKDSNDFSLKTLLNLCRELKNKGHDYVCFFDANVIHLPKDNLEKSTIKQLLTDKMRYRISPGGTRADDFIIMAAHNDNASVISNDWFRNLTGQYTWLDKNQTPQRLFKGSVYPSVNGDTLMIPDLKINCLVDQNIHKLISELNTPSNNKSQTTKTSNTMSNDFKVGKITAPRTFHQLGILVLDGSGSMTDPAKMNLTKAQSVHLAVKELLGRLKAGRVKDNFSFAITMFGGNTKEHTPVTSLSNIDDNGNFDPLIVDASTTRIFDGLAEAKIYAEKFISEAPVGSVNHSAIILLMSDGISEDPQKCITVAQELKSNPSIKVACAYFGTLGANDSAAQDLLQQICSDPTQYYKTTYDADELRKFFESSISKSVGINIG
jgi:uncharacterized protein YegL